MRIRSLICVLLACLAGFSRVVLAQAPDRAQAVLFTVDPKASQITYHAVFPPHNVEGISKSVTGAARVLLGGRAQVQVRVPVTSFLSGNFDRDEDVSVAVEAASFPAVELKAFTDDFTIPTSYPASLEKSFTAKVSFHGAMQQMVIPVQLIFESPDRIRAIAGLSISLEHFKVERPRMFYIQVDDTVRIDVSVLFKR